MPNRTPTILLAALFIAMGSLSALGQNRVWIADQGDNQGNNNRILEIDPYHQKPVSPGQNNVYIIETLPSPAGCFLDEISLDDNDHMWCVVKEENDQDPDGARRIDPNNGGSIDIPPGLITIDFAGEPHGGYLEGLAWDGAGLWITAVRESLAGNMMTRVDPNTGAQIAPFTSGAFVMIPGNIAQGALYEAGNGGYGWLWHSDWGNSHIYKLDLALLYDGDPGNDNNLVVADFTVPFRPKGMDWFDGTIWVASPNNGIWEFDPTTGATQKLFDTPDWNLDGLAVWEEPPGPKIVVDPDHLEQTSWIYHPAEDSAFTISNGGEDTLIYSFSDDADWLEVLPSGGSCTTESDNIVVSFVGVDTFPTGLYSATITVEGNAWNTGVEIPVLLTVRTAWADFDQDCDVDQTDFGMFQACYTGSGGPIINVECLWADFSGDGDVDLDDFSMFQACHTGEGICAEPGCDD